MSGYSASMQALRFTIGKQSLAVDLRWIREVCPFVHIRSLPHSPAWLRGLVDYHGQLLPVLDGGVLLGSEPVDQKIGARILLLHGPMSDEPGAMTAQYGLLVDSVDCLQQIDRADAWTAREGLPGLPFLKDVINVASGSVMVLDAAQLASLHANVLQGHAVDGQRLSLTSQP